MIAETSRDERGGLRVQHPGGVLATDGSSHRHCTKVVPCSQS